MILAAVYKMHIYEAKLTAYLLNTAHPDGGSKALFFTSNGFEAAETLELALLSIINNNPVLRQIPTPFGTKFIVDGIIESPAKRLLKIRTIWIVLKDNDICTFVTAYPL